MPILTRTGLNQWSDKFQGFGLREGPSGMTLRPTGSYFEDKVEETFGKVWEESRELSTSQWGVLGPHGPSLFLALFLGI